VAPILQVLVPTLISGTRYINEPERPAIVVTSAIGATPPQKCPKFHVRPKKTGFRKKLISRARVDIFQKNLKPGLGTS
jgi:hypothetical protein